MSNTNINALDLCTSFLKTAREAKASAKQADFDPSKPTTQPVMKADDGTVPATTGSRAAENISDVRKAYGNAGMTGQEDANSASSIKPSDSIGTVKQDADQMKGNVQSPKSAPPKPPESPNHPSNATFNTKYSAASALGNRILGAIPNIVKAAEHCEGDKAKKAPAAPASTASDANTPAATPEPLKNEKSAEAILQEKKAAVEKYKDDGVAGYMAGAYLLQQLGMGKSAAEETKKAEAAVDEYLGNIIKSAEFDADLLIEYMKGCAEGVKQAAAVRGNGATKQAEVPAEMLAADAGAGGGDPMAAMGGGGDPMAAMAGGAGGGDPMAAMGGGGGDEAASLEALAQMLAEAGISPEELEALIAQGGLGGGDAGAPGAGGPPPAMGAPSAGGAGGPAPHKASEGGESKPKEKSEPKEDEGSEDKEAALKKTAALRNAVKKLVSASK